MGSLDPSTYQTLPPHSEMVTSLDTVGDHGLISGSADGSVCYWDVRKAGGGTTLNVINPIVKFMVPDGQVSPSVLSVSSPLLFPLRRDSDERERERKKESTKRPKS